VKTLRDTAYTYIPVSELKEWRKELEEREPFPQNSGHWFMGLREPEHEPRTA